MNGAVAAPDLRSAEAGAAMLRAGGNGVDAAVAAVFTSFVVEFSIVSAMGGGFATIASPGGVSEVHDFFAAAPSGVPEGAEDFRPVDVNWGESTQRFHIGRASTAVPGCVAGLCDLLRQHGRLDLATVLRPAIAHATDGFTVSPFAARALSHLEEIFRDSPECEALFAPEGRLLRAGDRLVLADLAASLEGLAREGVDHFRSGAVGMAIVEDQLRHGGRIRGKDLMDYRPLTRAPLDIGFRDRRVILPPPPSTGGRQVALALSLWERLVPEVGLSREEWGQLMAQVLRVAFEADLTWEGEGPGMRSREREARGSLADPRSRDRLRVEEAGRIIRYLGEPNLAHLLARIRRRLMGQDLPAPGKRRSEAGGSNHVSVIDEDGLAVSITTSAGEGGGYLVPGCGLMMNNMLGEEDLHPGGFHLDPPGARLRSRMCPAVVLDGEEPILVVGGAGSARLWPAVFQNLVALLDDGLSPTAAVGRPRLHFDGAVLHVEGSLGRAERVAFAKGGFECRSWEGRHMFFGGVQIAARSASGFEGAGDPRRDGLCVTV